MKIGFDLGGVVSKYPEKFRELMVALDKTGVELFIITDMHDMSEILKQLEDNGFGFIKKENVYSADYNKYGNFCKAVLLKELKIDMFIDDFGAYADWDSQLGEAPIRLLVQPDNFKAYWDESWKCSGGEFGRKVAPKDLKNGRD